MKDENKDQIIDSIKMEDRDGTKDFMGEQVWKAIQEGLSHNSRNYGLYVMLGDYYLSENPNKAWLCYENALFYCKVPEDRQFIEQLLCRLKEQYKITVNKTSIVILSYNLLEYTKMCIESIRRTTLESAREIIVVDNASTDGSVEWLREQTDIVLVENKENAGFPVGCNQGILTSSEKSDIFLLNNDTVLIENALFWLRMGLYDKIENGAAGSVTNYAYNQTVIEGVNNATELMAFGEKTNVPMKYPYEPRIYLVGFALLIKRQVLNEVGLLDERFSPGNSEDQDYGLRVLKAGYRNVLCKNSFILHFGSKSFGKDLDKYAAAVQKNSQKLNEKWGLDIEYYSHWRDDLIGFINEPVERSVRFLDIGCGCGASMAHIQGIYPHAEAYGVEIIPEAAEIASHIGEVLCGNVEQIDLPWKDEFFDYIIMGDVLEHLMSPEHLLIKLRKYLKADGHIIVSMPNIKHYSVILPLLQKDEFTYADAGILDRTHVKMYTGTEIQRLVVRSGYKIEKLAYTTEGRPDKEEKAVIELLNTLMERPFEESWLAYQYILKASKV